MNRFLDRFSGIRITVLTSLLLGLTSLVPNVTGSALADEGPLSLSALIEELVAGNPEVKAARQRWEMAQALVPQVQTPPDPTIQLGYQKMPMVEPFQGAMYGIGQEIPFPGKLRLKGEVAQRDADRCPSTAGPTRDVTIRQRATHDPG